MIGSAICTMQRSWMEYGTLSMPIASRVETRSIRLLEAVPTSRPGGKDSRCVRALPEFSSSDVLYSST